VRQDHRLLAGNVTPKGAQQKQAYDDPQEEHGGRICNEGSIA